MTFLTSWEEFAKAAERLYTNDPMKCRFVTKYRHCDGKLEVKITDDSVGVYAYRWPLCQNAASLFILGCLSVICKKTDDRHSQNREAAENEQRGSILTERLRICIYNVKLVPTDCLQYRTEMAQDVKKLEKLTNQLMRHMASKEK